MLTSLALIFLLGLLSAELFRRLHLPRIIGMLLTGILIGPYALGWLDESILSISAQLRQLALVIILIKAGLSLSLKDLRAVGRPAVLMSCIPALMEIAACAFLGPKILGITMLEGAILGAVLGAVSPAVVVPKMVALIDEHRGTDKRIPQLILAGASLDDVFVIVLFYTFLQMGQGVSARVTDFLQIPVSILTGIGLGALIGLLLGKGFVLLQQKGAPIRPPVKVLTVLGVSCLLLAVETWLKPVLPFSGLLAIMSACCLLAMQVPSETSEHLKSSFGTIWIAAEVWLFVLVGAAVDIRYTVGAGGLALLMIFVSLLLRSLGVVFCLIGTDLSRKEKAFCVISYLPKATVQAAIGSVPLAAGLPCGKLVLSIAVLSILVTAPLGAIGMDLTDKRFLSNTSQ